MSETVNEKMPLRLEWVKAGSLTENPSNWRRHSQEQLSSIRDLLQDPGVGWAGACLYNERTGRLIDGHARKQVVDPETLVPVLVGSWSEEAEAKILATLDPVAAMASGDANAYAALIAAVETDSLWVRDLMHQTAAGIREAEEDGDKEEPEPDPTHLPAMDLQPFEHHDYVMLLFRNDQDFQRACELLGIQKVEIVYPGGLRKVGLGRCVDGAKGVDRLLAAGGRRQPALSDAVAYQWAGQCLRDIKSGQPVEEHTLQTLTDRIASAVVEASRPGGAA